MELSDFEIKVIDSLIKGDAEEQIIRQQLASATVTSRDRTGVGVFTEIEISKQAPRLSTSNRYIEETPKAHLSHPELKSGGGALLWFNEGKVSTLECYSYEDDWPKNEALFSIST